MGRYLQPGHEYTDGQTITGPSLTEHVADAVLKPTTISEQLLKDPAVLTDELLINDSGVFKKITLQSLKEIILLTLTSEELSDEVRIPVGSIMDFAGTSEPEGWIFCYGQELAKDGTYAELFAAIGTTYGEPTGVTFSVPDCRGRVTAGRDSMGGTSANRIILPLNGDTLGAAGGADRHTVSVAEMPSHAHTFSDFYHTIVANPGNGEIGVGAQISITAASTANSTTATGSSQAHNNMQPTIIFNKIIRYL